MQAPVLMPELVFLNAGMESGRTKRLLVLSIGYGQGHHSAGAAIAEYYSSTGWEARMVDACSEACPFLFRLTQEFYRFCVRRAPWLWGVTYSLTDTADELLAVAYAVEVASTLPQL